MVSKAPTYNLKVVVQETGVKPDTLRAWERRYGLPEPERTPGRHRLYSDYDIEVIKWLLARQNEGMSISKAVRMWRSLEGEGQDPLQARPSLAARAPTALSEMVAGSTLEEMRAQWVNACLDFNEQVAEAVLVQAFGRYPLETVCLDILRQGVAEVGTLWYEGKASVQQEHFTSALAVRRLDALIAAAPPPRRRERIVVGCPPKEEHIFAPLLLTLFLRQRGWEVIYLGANVPLERLREAIGSIEAKLVVSTAMQLFTAANLLEMAQMLEEVGVLLAFGGRVFEVIPALRSRVGGHYLGSRLDGVVDEIERLVRTSPMVAPAKGATAHYRKALHHFRERRAEIEAQMLESAQRAGLQGEHLPVVNMYLAQNIEAALTLGDMALVEAEIDWVRGLLPSYDVEPALLQRYLRGYHEAVQKHLDERGQPVKDWLAQVSVSISEENL